MSSCDENATPTPLPAIPATATPGAQEPAAGETSVPPTNDQLVVWLPASTGMAVEGNAGAILTNAFHQFEQRNPAIRLDIQVKADSGTAGLFNFLRSAQEVAPSILPDMVLINTQQLWQIVDLGMVVALSEQELLADADYFRAAADAVTYRGQTIGIPYAVDLVHLVYDGEAISAPPTTWDELLDSGEPYAFPAGEAGPVISALLHYVGAGGALLEDGTISNPEALETYFTFLAQARDQGIIGPSTLDMSAYPAAWRAFAEDRVNLAEVQANQFYPNITGINPPSYASVPTSNGESVTIAETWAFAILTEDSQRRELALSLIGELLVPEVHGPWSQAVARLPSRPASFAQWTQANAYRDFAEALLEDAVTPANGPAFADFARRLHTAQAGIIRGDLTVEAAIASMVAIE
jgi:ABC-type glycerol-3-phosphate transport system substrate-binding protein